MWLRLTQYAVLYEVHPATVRNWIRRNRVTIKRIERTIFVWEDQRPAAVMAVIRARTEPARRNGHSRK